MKSPVVYNLFKRPKVVRIVFGRIRLLKPPILYLFSDGPRNDIEAVKIKESRDLVISMIDWDCNLKVYFLEVNIGPDSMQKFTFDTVFNYEDRMIYLEEDMLPSFSFFRFCDELLEYYLTDESVYIIGGMNFLQDYSEINEFSYLFQSFTSTWGIAIWKRTYLRIDYELSNLKIDYYKKLVLHKLRKMNMNFYKILNNKIDGLIVNEGEFWLMGYNENVLNGALAIVPSKNLIKNIGDSEGAENGDERKLLSFFQRWIFDLDELEIEFPLIHQKQRITDDVYTNLVYRKSKVGPVKLFIIKFERTIRILIYRGPRQLLIKIMKKLNI